MPTPSFAPVPHGKITLRSIVGQHQDILIHSAWQDDSLIWLGLGWVKNGADAVQVRARQACPWAQFVSSSDMGETARIVACWQQNRLTDLKMTLYGTPFRQRVWQELLRLAPLERPSYGQIAARIGKPKASRAVGSAVGANPISLLVPCHRILPQSGGVGQYGWGTTLKAHLLAMEQALYANKALVAQVTP